ncbi:hypothetical protein V6N13_030807 [Hibiscus sabdariffa]|uniref:Calcineurin-like phosphoesterase domain-containing protein n=1 Tax=Hibiscus sabdariffa TaxID=183260 RepID=A0ABR2D806_9ROSI
MVVGELHEQLHDLLFLFQEADFPSGNRIFVFNGDYVDRGAWGLRIFLLLLASKNGSESHENYGVSFLGSKNNHENKSANEGNTGEEVDG